MSNGKLNIINRKEYAPFLPSPRSVYKSKRRVSAVTLEMVSHDEEFEKLKKENKAILITNPEILVNNKKPIDGIFSPLFGADTTQDTPVFTCDCHKTVGGANQGRICPECGTEVRSIEADLRILGHVDISPFHIMSYHGYNALSSVISNLNEIITSVRKINIKGKLIDDPDGMTLMDIYENYDEKFYPITGLPKKYAFTSKIPVYSSRLRPLMYQGATMTMLDVNKSYLAIVKLYQTMKYMASFAKKKPEIAVQRTLNEIQQHFNMVCKHITTQIDSKNGVMRRMLCSGRVDYSSRLVITHGLGLQSCEIDIPYETAMVIYEEEIVNRLSRLEDIPLSKAIGKFILAKSKRDDTFVNIINQLIKEKRGLWALINRNPTINESGILYVRVRQIHFSSKDITLRLPPDILPLLAADLTGLPDVVRYDSNIVQEQFGERLTSGVCKLELTC